MYDLRLKKSKDGSRTWVAMICGLDQVYGYNRLFISPYRKSDQYLYYKLEDEFVYDINDPTNDVREICSFINSELKKLTKKQVDEIACLLEVDEDFQKEVEHKKQRRNEAYEWKRQEYKAERVRAFKEMRAENTKRLEQMKIDKAFKRHQRKFRRYVMIEKV